jgi:hypothetical protein
VLVLRCAAKEEDESAELLGLVRTPLFFFVFEFLFCFLFGARPANLFCCDGQQDAFLRSL